MTNPPDPTNDHILDGQPKPTGEQVAWVLAHFCDLWESGHMQSYGYIMQRMYGYPSREKMVAISQGQCLANVINCAKESEEVKKLYREIFSH